MVISRLSLREDNFKQTKIRKRTNKQMQKTNLFTKHLTVSGAHSQMNNHDDEDDDTDDDFINNASASHDHDDANKINSKNNKRETCFFLRLVHLNT